MTVTQPSDPPALDLERVMQSVETLAFTLVLDVIGVGVATGQLTTLDDLRKLLRWWVKIGGPEFRDVVDQPDVRAALDRRKCDLVNGYFNNRGPVERIAKARHAAYLARKAGLNGSPQEAA